MGAWGYGTFENDAASDWLYELEASAGLSVVAAALHAVTESSEDDLDAGDCSCALAAAEIVAALRGHPVANLPDNAMTWIAAQQALDGASLVPVAQEAILRIHTKSELKELWNESDEAPKWYAAIEDISARLIA